MANSDIRRGFLIAEEEALKAKLSNLTVRSPKSPGGRAPVKVWFSQPESERVRTYPYITIDLISIDLARDRVHSAEITPIDYWPSEYPTFAEWATAHNIAFDPDTQIPYATRWHPYNISFQVATHSLYAAHDRELLSTLLGTAYLPMSGWGYLPVPADDSQRWLDCQGFGAADYNAGSAQKAVRVFRKIFNVVVSAHLPPEDPFIYYKVLAVAGSISTIDGDSLASWSNT